MGAFFTRGDTGPVAERMMDLFPYAQLGPQPEVVVAGLPRRKIIGHEAPGTAHANDVEDAVDDRALRVFDGPASQGQGRLWQKRAKNLPFRIAQATGVTRHDEFLQYPTKIVQIQITPKVIFQTASKFRDAIQTG